MMISPRPPASRPSPYPPWLGLASLLALLGLVYAPVLLRLPLRTTGDEKVYIAQAVEMAGSGSWFQQSLFGVANYYKGPLFYLLLRLGMVLFGATSPLALTYMNVCGLAGAAVALWHLIRRSIGGDYATALLVPLLVVFSAGAYAHALAGQMEALLVVAYAVFMALLGSAPAGAAGAKERLAAWIVAGLAGLLKSPVHALLLGVSALLYWTLSGQLKQQATRAEEWAAALVGVAVCGLGYAPALLWDRQAFLDSYIARETFGRSANGVGLDEAVLPFLTAHLMPWLPLFIAALWVLGRSAIGGDQRANGPGAPVRRLLQLALAVAVPTVVFFLVHPCRSGIYIMPVLPAAAVVIGAAWHVVSGAPHRAFTFALNTIAVLLAILTAAVAAVVLRFAPFPAWWGSSTSAIAVGGLGLAAVLTLMSARRRAPQQRVGLLLAACAGMYLGIGQVMVALEAHEEVDVRELALATKGASVWHANLNKHLWSETGLQSFMLDLPVGGLYTPDQLELVQLTRTAHQEFGPLAVTVPDEEQLAALTAYGRRHADWQLQVYPWRRWKMRGLQPGEESTLLQAWRSGSLATLERHEYLLLVQRDPHLNFARGSR